MKGSSEVLTGVFREGVREACKEFIGFQKTDKVGGHFRERMYTSKSISKV